jgi:hypothetical protein
VPGVADQGAECATPTRGNARCSWGCSASSELASSRRCGETPSERRRGQHATPVLL